MGRVTKIDRINQQWITMKTDKIELKKKGVILYLLTIPLRILHWELLLNIYFYVHIKGCFYFGFW